MKVWVISDDYYHPGDVVEQGLMPLEQKGVEFTFTRDTSSFDPKQLNNYDVVILAKNDTTVPSTPESWDENHWMTDEVIDAFEAYVKSGHGWMILHSGLTGYNEKTKRLYEMIGSRFNFHPEQCPVTIKKVADHPIMDGVEEYTLKDEHYHLHMMTDDLTLVFETVSEHGTCPGGYVRTMGKGRICVLTPGHNIENWTNPNYQKILYQAMCWTKGE